ncbi:MAG: sensor histidine kinase [Gemmatimonadaceae bacterium]
MRRSAPVVLVAVGLLLLLGSYIAYTQQVVSELRGEARRTGRMFARVLSALSDPSEDRGTHALLELSREIREMGVPMIVTDPGGRPAAFANLPFEASLDDPRVADFVRELDATNPPVVEPGIGTVHYGNPPLVRGLRVIPILQASALIVLLVGGVYALKLRGRAQRERVWAGMARESAHQLATPLSSLSGWVELLEERASDGAAASAVGHMRSDLERLERVAHRFERIGRPPRRDRVDVAALVDGVGAYFRARVPTLAHVVTVRSGHDETPLVVEGDAVLLEWALEALAKNAIDALAGRGGELSLHASREDDGTVRIRVSDDGPGIPRELRRRVFDAGFSTKERGWGIGLSLARRIVRDNHRGRLVLVPTSRGATFDVILR